MTEENDANEEQDNAGIVTHPPFFYILAGLVGWGINVLYPLSFGMPDLNTPVSITVFVLGLIIFVLSVKTFKENEQSPSVHASQPKVLRTGIYGYSRNPIYVAASLWLVSVSLYFDNVWMLIMLAPLLIFMTSQVIKKEEAYLEGKFGDDYRDYKKKVRRWI